MVVVVFQMIESQIGCDFWKSPTEHPIQSEVGSVRGVTEGVVVCWEENTLIAFTLPEERTRRRTPVPCSGPCMNHSLRIFLWKYLERIAQKAVVMSMPFLGPMKKFSCPLAATVVQT